MIIRFGFEGMSFFIRISKHYLQKNANSVFFLLSLWYNGVKFEVAVDFAL